MYYVTKTVTTCSLTTYNLKVAKPFDTVHADVLGPIQSAMDSTF